MIDNSTSCKIRAVIHFFHAKNMSAVEIHRELWQFTAKVLTKKFVKDGTFSEFLYEFQQISRSLPYEIITDRLGYHKF
jgi:hypothetical protein